MSTSEVTEIQMPPRLVSLLAMPEVDEATKQLHGWNVNDKSVNIFVKKKMLTDTTDCIRTITSYSSGLHAFKLTWPIVGEVGVATSDAVLHAQGYTSLIGRDANSWGWDLMKRKAFHNGEYSDYPTGFFPRSQQRDEFIMVLDMDAGTLAFIVDGKYLGVAHSGLKGKKLFPIVSTVCGVWEISIQYLHGLDRDQSLMSLCRQVVWLQIGKENIEKGNLKQLNLPEKIIKYLGSEIMTSPKKLSL